MINISYHVESRGYTTPCWIALGSLRNGYGIVSNPNYKGRGQSMLQAHIVMYRQVKGDVPSGLELDHLCRNRSCVNPDHLEPVTRAINVQRGKSAKINMDTARLIRKDYLAGCSTRIIARRYGVSHGSVYYIGKGLSWKEPTA